MPKRQKKCLLQETDGSKKVEGVSTSIRARLGAENLIGDKWFSFGKTSYREFRGNPQSPSKLVAEINQLILTVAIPWWDEKDRDSKSY